MLILPSFIVTTRSSIDGNLTCRMIEKNEFSCKFECTIFPTYGENKIKRELQGRVVVFHSVWTAIFDRTYKMKSLQKNYFRIELPRRNYTYIGLVSLYDDSNHIGVSNKVKLQC